MRGTLSLTHLRHDREGLQIQGKPAATRKKKQVLYKIALSEYYGHHHHVPLFSVLTWEKRAAS